VTKYRNHSTEFDGKRFDSAAEAGRYRQLRLQEQRGEIFALCCQVPFVIAPGIKIEGAKRKSPAIRYFADFVYERRGQRVVEDVKGALTDVYKLKRHLLALQGITITEIRA
jgi:hypothetical protein